MQSFVFQHLTYVTSKIGLVRPFNPAIAALGDAQLLTVFRSAFGRASTISTLTITEPSRGLITRTLNLSAHNRDFDIERTHDARLFWFGQDLYMTFNTGHPESRSAQNSVFTQRVFPEVGEPLPLEIKPRQRVEKNILFEEVSGSLVAHYGYRSTPVSVITNLTGWSICPPTGNAVNVHELDGRTPNARRGPRRTYGQGTPWTPWGSSSVAIVNERTHWSGLRSYQGRLVVRRDAAVTMQRGRLYHGAMSRLGSMRRRNKRLLHCTYFSGMTVFGGRLLVSYGINDSKFGVVDLTDVVG